MFSTLNSDDISYFKGVIGEKNVIQDEERLLTANTDWMRKYRGSSKLLLQPSSTEEVGFFFFFSMKNIESAFCCSMFESKLKVWTFICFLLLGLLYVELSSVHSRAHNLLFLITQIDSLSHNLICRFLLFGVFVF